MKLEKIYDDLIGNDAIPDSPEVVTGWDTLDSLIDHAGLERKDAVAISDACTDLCAARSEQSFAVGFRLGAKLMVEIYKED